MINLGFPLILFLNNSWSFLSSMILSINKYKFITNAKGLQYWLDRGREINVDINSSNFQAMLEAANSFEAKTNILHFFVDINDQSLNINDLFGFRNNCNAQLSSYHVIIDPEKMFFFKYFAYVDSCALN